MICKWSLSLAGDTEGTAGAPFLKIGPGARAASLGDSFAAICDDPTAIYWNPAGLIQIKFVAITTMYANWFQEIGYGYIAGVYPISGKDSIGASVSYVSMDDLKGYADETDDTIEYFSAYDSCISFAYSHSLTDSISFGVTVKGIIQKIEDNQALGIALDFGELYQTPINGLTLGVAIQNIGPEIEFINEGDKLPSTLKIGLAYGVKGMPLLLSCDFNKPIDNDWRLNCGIECRFSPALRFRVGYNSQLVKDLETDGFCGGLGFKLGNYQVDYAYVPYNNELLGETHRFSIGLEFREI